MAVFDPYHKWLGIPASEQPPTLYRLLGISPFESDLDVIDGAANRQMAYVRGFASGPHAADSQRILNELSAARLRLLDPRRKMAYDAELRERLNPPSSVPAPVARPESPLRAEILPAPVEPVGEARLPMRVKAPGRSFPALRRDWGRGLGGPGQTRLLAIAVGLGVALLAAGILWDRPTRREGGPSAVAELQPLAADPADDHEPAGPSLLSADLAEDEEADRPSGIPGDAVAFEGSYYKVFWERISWPEAEEKCRLAGGRLACPESPEAQKFLADLKGEGNVVWVGGYRHRSGLWRWINGNGIVAGGTGGVEDGFNHVAFTIHDDLNCRTTSGHAPGYGSEWVEGYICEWPAGSEREGSSPPFDLTLSEPVGEVRRFTGHTGHLRAVAFSPDGRRVATGGNDKTIRVWDVQTGRELWKSTEPKGDMVRDIAFSPDGRRVHGCDTAGYRVLNAETGKTEKSIDVRVDHRGAFSNDCASLLARHYGGTMSVYNVADGRVLQKVSQEGGGSGIAFSSNGRRIYYATGGITELNRDSKRIRSLDVHPHDNPETIAVSRNGERMAWGSGPSWQGNRRLPGERMARVWDTRSERVIAEFRGNEGWLWSVAISADGRRVLTGGGGYPDDVYGQRPGADTSMRWTPLSRPLGPEFKLCFGLAHPLQG